MSAGLTPVLEGALCLQAVSAGLTNSSLTPVLEGALCLQV